MSVVVREQVTDAEVAGVLAVVEAASAADGVAPLGESVLLRLRDGGGALLTFDDDVLAGVAARDGDAAELAVHPAYRRRGHGRALASRLLTDGPVNVWAHGELPGAVGLAEALGFERFRALWKMRRPLAAPLPPVEVPTGVRLRTFEVGRDEDAWVRVNARAFADHPEQGKWTRDDLVRRQAEPWFSAAGFFLAERDGEVIGFHWTKVDDEPGAAGRSHGGEAQGEVYVVGVDPDAQGLGLGKVLTLAGLHHLRDLGLATVVLYADESNSPAVHMYEKLGFEHFATDAQYRH